MEPSSKNQKAGTTAASPAFLACMTDGYDPAPEDMVEDSLLEQYQRVIVESLLTTFALDGIVHDQNGGDVDTVLNVRKGIYKNPENFAAYENRGTYSRKAYHDDRRVNKEGYSYTVKAAKIKFNNDGTMIDDAYVPDNMVMPVKNPSVPLQRQAQLDHVVAAKSVHDDPGRVLAGLDGASLANSPENLRFTNAALNNNMRDKSVDEYLAWCQEHPDKVNWGGTRGEPMPKKVEARLRQEYDRARASYELKVAKSYYSSPAFLKDTLSSAQNVAKKMGIRQAVGFVLAEVVVVVTEELNKLPKPFELGEFLRQLGRGIKRGFQSALSKFKTILERFAQGALAGALASIGTTLCNIFFTTAKNVVRVIRQIWASLVRAAEILFINPDRYPFGVRMRMVVTVIGTGASAVLGTIVQEAINKTPIGTIPVIGDLVAMFCGTLVSGLLACTFVHFLNHSPKMKQLIDALDRIPTIDSAVEQLRQQALYFERYAAELEKIDYEAFRREVEMYEHCADRIEAAASEEELNTVLKDIVTSIGLPIPWGEGSFDDFMHDKSRRLVFG